MDPYRDIAAYYDCEHAPFQEDIAFYLQAIDAGPVLEIGAGTGRVTSALARSGIEIWGIDPSEAMLSRARLALRGVDSAHLIQGTVSDLAPEQRFRIAIAPLNTFWHLHDTEEQFHLLHDIRARLEPRGTLIVDLSNPLALADRGARGELRERFAGRCQDGFLRVASAAWDSEADQTLRLSLVYDLTRADGSIHRTHGVLELRYLYRYELELLLRESGFNDIRIYGTYDLEPYATDSPNLLAVAKAAG